MPATNVPYELLKLITRFDLERVFIGEQGRGILQYQAECVDLQGSNSIKHLDGVPEANEQCPRQTPQSQRRPATGTRRLSSSAAPRSPPDPPPSPPRRPGRGRGARGAAVAVALRRRGGPIVAGAGGRGGAMSEWMARIGPAAHGSGRARDTPVFRTCSIVFLRVHGLRLCSGFTASISSIVHLHTLAMITEHAPLESSRCPAQQTHRLAIYVAHVIECT
jgi:hypothetical protein